MIIDQQAFATRLGPFLDIFTFVKVATELMVHVAEKLRFQTSYLLAHLCILKLIFNILLLILKFYDIILT